ncbi:MAG: peptide deformylase [Candidatus Omnitrophica bacterium]|nr:peptide deformylase [Candidatus Omnitrophota bacterium]
MGTMQIRKYPDSILRQECQAVAEIMDKEIRLFEDMLTTMRSSQGIGLAAPQVGINKRIIVIDIGEGPIKIANPEIIKLGKAKESMGEGCLSVPDAIVDVSRPSEVIIKGLNEKNRPVEIKAKGLLARVILHELDHLNGKLIVDYMSFLRKIDYRLKTRNKLHM